MLRYTRRSRVYILVVSISSPSIFLFSAFFLLFVSFFSQRIFQYIFPSLSFSFALSRWFLLEGVSCFLFFSQGLTVSGFCYLVICAFLPSFLVFVSFFFYDASSLFLTCIFCTCSVIFYLDFFLMDIVFFGVFLCFYYLSFSVIFLSLELLLLDFGYCSCCYFSFTLLLLCCFAVVVSTLAFLVSQSVVALVSLCTFVSLFCYTRYLCFRFYVLFSFVCSVSLFFRYSSYRLIIIFSVSFCSLLWRWFL